MDKQIATRKNEIQERTFKFAVLTLKFINTLPRNIINLELRRQLIRSCTSIGANIEEALGSRSKKEFINSMNIAKREARETGYWLKLLKEINSFSDMKIYEVINESESILRILTSIVKTSDSIHNS